MFRLMASSSAPRLRPALSTLVVAAALTATAACGSTAAGSRGADPEAGPGTGTEALEGEVTVLAAASLNAVVPRVADQLEAEHPGLSVTTSFGASSTLAQQVVAGAPADVVVTASATTMQTVVDAGRTAGDPVLVARNSLEIAVPPDNPAGVSSLEDLADPEVKLALCAPEVPCGATAATLLDLVGVEATPVTLGRDVTATLTQVRLGEVDAALVYRTDVVGAGDDVVGIEVPRAGEVVTDYPAAVVEGSKNPAAARAVVDQLSSGRGQEVLREAGFTAP